MNAHLFVIGKHYANHMCVVRLRNTVVAIGYLPVNGLILFAKLHKRLSPIDNCNTYFIEIESEFKVTAVSNIFHRSMHIVKI